MHVYYRISDKGNPKEKLEFADKFYCLSNAMQEFGKEFMHVIADNCNPETIGFLKQHELSYEETSLGNSASFMYMLDLVLSKHKDEEAVYLLEDDYIHLKGAKDYLEDGLSIADYVTLYDHPDKYRMVNDGGNPFNYRELAPCRIYLGNKTHWRSVDSTTMTFAVKVQTLKEDYAIWQKYTRTRNPKDFYGFMELHRYTPGKVFEMLKRKKRKAAKIMLINIINKSKNRLVISAVPAKATHAETAHLAPLVPWTSL